MYIQAWQERSRRAEFWKLEMNIGQYKVSIINHEVAECNFTARLSRRAVSVN